MKKNNASSYHYRECGLDNVYLLNGFERVHTKHGDGVRFLDVDGLHQAIGLSLVTHDRHLSGREFRFLRGELGATQKIIADLFDVNVQTVARWEKGETDVTGPADRLLRLLYLEDARAKYKVRDILTTLSEMDADAHDAHNFMLDKQRHWRWANAA